MTSGADASASAELGGVDHVHITTPGEDRGHCRFLKYLKYPEICCPTVGISNLASIGLKMMAVMSKLQPGGVKALISFVKSKCCHTQQ